MAGVPFTDLERTFRLHEREYEEAVLSTLRGGWYILGTQLETFEEEFASFLGADYCIGVGCGQDALVLAVRALGIGPGDEVIIAGNTYIATVLGVTENGATPVLVDCNEFFEMDEGLIEEAITENTKAVLLTNLYGQCCDLQTIRDICDKAGLYMIEDCAQSHGASFSGVLGGTICDVACFSFYPTKPLGGAGDGGACVTNSKALAEKIRMLRNYGSRQKYVNEECGINSRLDELQAAFLRVGLNHLEDSNRERQRIAQRYLDEIDNPLIELPRLRDGADHVWHIFAIRCDRRDELQDHLSSHGIATQVHYPIPPHQAKCYEGQPFAKVTLPNTELFAKTELSLPIYAGMPEDDIDAVINAVNSFRG